MPYQLVDGQAEDAVRHALRIAAIGATTWLVLRIAYALSDPPLARLMRIEESATGGPGGPARRCCCCAASPR